MSATALASEIRSGATSSRDVVEAHIDALIGSADRNAWVAERFEPARAEADAADADVAAQHPRAQRPFHGVPFTVKESIATAGMPWTAGLVARRGLRARHDAPVVARMRAAGAIPLASTNVSELCMWMESSNAVYGRTANAYDAGRIAGGSSGGEGSAIGAGASPMGIGADVGGSIRMPAFFNGVFGHKATPGMIPNAGQHPTSDGPLLATGPLARRAVDLYPLLQTLAGPHPDCPRTRDVPLADPSSVSLVGLAVLDVPDNGIVAVSETLRAAQRRAADALLAAGASVQPAAFGDLKQSFLMWGAAMGEEEGSGAFRGLLGRRWSDLLPHLIRRDHHTLPAVVLGLVEDLPGWLPGGNRGTLAALHRLRAEILEQLGDGVLLYPSYAEVAPPHNQPIRTPWRFVYTAVWNALQLPACQVPLGLDAQGLPTGIQVVTAPGNDATALAVASALERAYGGWVPPWLAAGHDASPSFTRA
jgi:fatty acid amide hydrolase 2